MTKMNNFFFLLHYHSIEIYIYTVNLLYQSRNLSLQYTVTLAEINSQRICKGFAMLCDSTETARKLRR